ncbi:hypothetical protein PMIN02_001597 [Paraphaeosphaeria minitans]
MRSMHPRIPNSGSAKNSSESQAKRRTKRQKKLQSRGRGANKHCRDGVCLLRVSSCPRHQLLLYHKADVGWGLNNRVIREETSRSGSMHDENERHGKEKAPSQGNDTTIVVSGSASDPAVRLRERRAQPQPTAPSLGIMCRPDSAKI